MTHCEIAHLQYKLNQYICGLERYTFSVRIYVMGGYISPLMNQRVTNTYYQILPRVLVTVLSAAVLNSLICHPVTTRFIGWNDRHHHHICHADKHHILFSAPGYGW